MNKIQIAGLSALTLFGSLSSALAQSATTDPVGYNTVTCLANSDTIVSVPFLDTTDSISSSVSGSVTTDGTKAEFTMEGITGLTTDQYATQYYVRFTSGTLDGNVYQITNNGASTVKIELNGDSQSDISAADTFKIYKFWTLGTLFPQATQSTIVESANNFPFSRRTEVFLPDTTSEGTNLAANRIYFLSTLAGTWIDNNGFGNADDTILWPDTYFIIRHPSTVTEATTYTATGSVDTHSKFVIPLATRTGGEQDNFIAIPRPIDVALKDLGLISSGAFVTSANNFPFSRRDQLFVFDNTSTALNKAASKIYFHNGTNWVNNDGFTNADEEKIKASEGIIIRKYQTGDGATHYWSNTPSY